MNPRKTKEIARSLENKGFVKAKRDHAFYFLHINDKKTRIHTKLSWGIKEYGSNLLSRVARGLRLSNSQLNDLLDCPLSKEDYVKLLIKNGEIEL